MTLAVIMSLMILSLYLGKKYSVLGLRQLIILFFLALLQVGIVLFDAFTKKMPPLL